MAPRKRIHKNASSRAMAAQERMKAAGMKRIAVWLDAATVERLDRLARAQGRHRAQMIEVLVWSTEEPD